MKGECRNRVLIVEHQSMLRDGLSALITTQGDMELVHACAAADEALERYMELRPDLTLVDIHLPYSGALEVIRRIRSCEPGARIIALVSYEWDEMAEASLIAGASAYLAKDQIGNLLLPMIRSGNRS
jgi:two-component system, NarL family, response regulator